MIYQSLFSFRCNGQWKKNLIPMCTHQVFIYLYPTTHPTPLFAVAFSVFHFISHPTILLKFMPKRCRSLCKLTEELASDSPPLPTALRSAIGIFRPMIQTPAPTPPLGGTASPRMIPLTMKMPLRLRFRAPSKALWIP